MIGANVIVAGTTNGVISGLDGGFTLSVSPNDRIEVSYMGYIKQIIPLNGRKTIKVIMRMTVSCWKRLW